MKIREKEKVKMGYLRNHMRSFFAASIFLLSVISVVIEQRLVIEEQLFQLPIGGTSIDPPQDPRRSFPSSVLPRFPSTSSSNPGTRPLKPVPRPRFFMSTGEDSDQSFSLQYDFYRESCPTAERFIRKAVWEAYKATPSVAPSLVRLVFHDCFIEGCDASVLLDPDEGIDSEKDSPSNQFLKGFHVIDAIKSELEKLCPEIVSCADILVLAAREAILLSGGPFYPLYTGRKDSPVAFRDIATKELPSPQDDLSQTLAAFASRGFDAQETVSLLGAHSVGLTHCRFFEDRLYNFSGTGQPDPSLDPGFLQELTTKCQPKTTSTASSPSQSPSPWSSTAPSSAFLSSGESLEDRTDQAVDISFQEEGGGGSFGTHYYRRLLQNKGLLYADQQLMAGEETGTWVRTYASNPVLFRHNFALAMMKLSNLNILAGLLGQVRRNCSKVLA